MCAWQFLLTLFVQNGCQVASATENPQSQSPKDPPSTLTAVDKKQELKRLKCDIKMCRHSQLSIVLFVLDSCSSVAFALHLLSLT